MNKKRGVFFTIDAILAAGIFVAVILLVSSSHVSEPDKAQASFTSQDIIKVFTNLKVEEIDNGYIQNLIDTGVITKVDNTILEQIGEFWADGTEEKLELAKKFTSNVTYSLIPERMGFGLYVDGEEIYLRDKDVTRSIISSRKIISGITKSRPTDGFTSRAILGRITSKTNTKYYPFDVIAPCYRGWASENADTISIEYTIDLPDDAAVTYANWTIVPAIANTDVDAYINNFLVFSGEPDEDGIGGILGNFAPGENKVGYTQTYDNCPGDDGTTHMVLTYETSQLQTLDNKTKFPLAVVYADGRINDYEKPIFAPNVNINKINITLNANASSVDLDFRFGGTEFDIGSKAVEDKYVEWTNDEISSALSANGLNYGDLEDSYFYFIFDFDDENGNVTIFPNSNVIIEGEEDIPFGSIDVSQTIEVASQSDPTGWGWCPNSYRDVDYSFNLPDGATHLYADWLIGWCWWNNADQIAQANGIDLYRHIEGDPGSDPFIEAFARFGYTKDAAVGSVVAGQNTFSLQFGNLYSTKPVISYGENVFVIPNSISYSSVLEKAEGCKWVVEKDEGGETTMNVPTGYAGSNNCEYKTTGIVYDADDSEQATAFGIFQLLDLDDDGDVDILVSEGDLEINTIVLSKVPSLWGPAIVEIRVWE